MYRLGAAFTFVVVLTQFVGAGTVLAETPTALTEICVTQTGMPNHYTKLLDAQCVPSGKTVEEKQKSLSGRTCSTAAPGGGTIKGVCKICVNNASQFEGTCKCTSLVGADGKSASCDKLPKKSGSGTGGGSPTPAPKPSTDPTKATADKSASAAGANKQPAAPTTGKDAASPGPGKSVLGSALNPDTSQQKPPTPLPKPTMTDQLPNMPPGGFSPPSGGGGGTSTPPPTFFGDGGVASSYDPRAYPPPDTAAPPPSRVSVAPTTGGSTFPPPPSGSGQASGDNVPSQDPCSTIVSADCMRDVVSDAIKKITPATQSPAPAPAAPKQKSPDDIGFTKRIEAAFQHPVEALAPVPAAQAKALGLSQCQTDPAACFKVLENAKVSVYKRDPKSRINCSTSACTMKNGLPLDDNGLTIASDRGPYEAPLGKGGLPINTVAVIEGPTGKIAVAVADTGVFNQDKYHNRAADLTKAVARAVGVPENGIGNVKITPLATYSTPRFAYAVRDGLNRGLTLEEAEQAAQPDAKKERVVARAPSGASDPVTKFFSDLGGRLGDVAKGAGNIASALSKSIFDDFSRLLGASQPVAPAPSAPAAVARAAPPPPERVIEGQVSYLYPDQKITAERTDGGYVVKNEKGEALGTAKPVASTAPKSEQDAKRLAQKVKDVVTRGTRLGFVVGDKNDPKNANKETWIWTREGLALNQALAKAGLPTLTPVYTRHYFAERQVGTDGSRVVNAHQLDTWQKLTDASTPLPGSTDRVFNMPEGPELERLMGQLKDGETGRTGLVPNQNYASRDLLRALVLGAANLGMPDTGYILATTEAGHANHRNGNDADFRPGPREYAGDPAWWNDHIADPATHRALGDQFHAYAYAYKELGIAAPPQSGFYGPPTGHIGTDNPGANAWNQIDKRHPFFAAETLRARGLGGVYDEFRSSATRAVTYDTVAAGRERSFASVMPAQYEFTPASGGDTHTLAGRDAHVRVASALPAAAAPATAGGVNAEGIRGMLSYAPGSGVSPLAFGAMKQPTMVSGTTRGFSGGAFGGAGVSAPSASGPTPLFAQGSVPSQALSGISGGNTQTPTFAAGGNTGAPALNTTQYRLPSAFGGSTQGAYGQLGPSTYPASQFSQQTLAYKNPIPYQYSMNALQQAQSAPVTGGSAQALQQALAYKNPLPYQYSMNALQSSQSTSLQQALAYKNPLPYAYSMSGLPVSAQSPYAPYAGGPTPLFAQGSVPSQALSGISGGNTQTPSFAGGSPQNPYGQLGPSTYPAAQFAQQTPGTGFSPSVAPVSASQYFQNQLGPAPSVQPTAPYAGGSLPIFAQGSVPSQALSGISGGNTQTPTFAAGGNTGAPALNTTQYRLPSAFGGSTQGAYGQLGPSTYPASQFSQQTPGSSFSPNVTPVSASQYFKGNLQLTGPTAPATQSGYTYTDPIARPYSMNALQQAQSAPPVSGTDRVSPDLAYQYARQETQRVAARDYAASLYNQTLQGKNAPLSITPSSSMWNRYMDIGAAELGKPTPVASASAPIPPSRPSSFSPASFQNNIGFGAHGSDVKALQQRLIDEGYLKLVHGPSGYYGLLTQNAVIRYQRAHGVLQTGFTGPVTRCNLNGGTYYSRSATCRY